MQLIAHRGFAEQYPENTLTAVRRAAERADAVEIDVRRCATGELVAFHDETLERLTDGVGPLRETPWETLRELKVLDSRESIPRLATVLDAVPADVGVNVELKHGGMAADVLAAADDAENEILISSFERDALRAARERDSSASLAYLWRHESIAGFRTALALDCEFLHPHYDRCLGTDLVERAHGAGLGVNAWTVRSADVASALREAGVDGMIADRWDVR